MKAYILRGVPDDTWRKVKAIAQLDQRLMDAIIADALLAYVNARYGVVTEEQTGREERS